MWSLACAQASKTDFDWLRINLVRHPLLEAVRVRLAARGGGAVAGCTSSPGACVRRTQEIAWPSDAERLQTNQVLRAAGLLPPGFENFIGMADGTKDESKKARDYAEQEKDYSGNKGHGKSHMMVRPAPSPRPSMRGTPCASSGHVGRTAEQCGPAVALGQVPRVTRHSRCARR